MAKPQHHVRQEVCLTRAAYREGRKPTAVKVYTIHSESKYLLVQGVPAVGTSNEIVKLFEVYGDIEEHRVLDDYPCEQFTETHLIKYKRIQSARFAKRKLDDWSFYGGVLHVCYSPEFETVKETREKLTERRRVVESKIRQYRTDGTYTGSMCVQQDSQNSMSTKQSNKEYNNLPHRGVPANSYTRGHNVHRTILDSSTQQHTYSVHDTHTVSTTTGGHGIDITAQYGNQQGHDRDIHDQYGNENMLSGNYQSDSNYSYNTVNNFNNHEMTESNLRTGGGVNSIKPVHDNPITQVPTNYMTPVQAKHITPVQQAQSLRHYGYHGGKDSKHPNKRAQSEISRTDQDKDDNAKADESDCLNDEQLFLPTPPKQTRTRVDSRHRPHFDVARVPSAQAGFPADFDARTVKDSPVETLLAGNDKNEITGQQKVEESLKSKNVVIKQYNKTGSVPKFVPRQAITKKKNGLNLEADTLNTEIRTNAFKLGKVQGPADNGPCTSNEKLDTKEKTVIDSVQNIRKKLAHV